MEKKERVIKRGIRALGKGPVKEGIAPGMINLAEKAYHDLEQVLRVKACHRVIPQEKKEEWLMGRSITRHLEEASSLLIYAVTLGHGVDRRIREISVVDLSYGVVLDALANEYLEEELKACFREWEGIYGRLAGPFSPGYGDYPLVMSRRMIDRLKEENPLEISVTPSCHLRPKKTVTGITGILQQTAGDQEGTVHRQCHRCSMNKDCDLTGKNDPL